MRVETEHHASEPFEVREAPLDLPAHRRSFHEVEDVILAEYSSALHLSAGLVQIINFTLRAEPLAHRHVS